MPADQVWAAHGAHTRADLLTYLLTYLLACLLTCLLAYMVDVAGRAYMVDVAGWRWWWCGVCVCGWGGGGGGGGGGLLPATPEVAAVTLLSVDMCKCE